ncbi:MAG TPA: ABC transporter permease subunit, partial [Kiloniellaceae bacterium]|nr:ABC transporter permease subunit [Kiloniellaceae bacterium]
MSPPVSDKVSSEALTPTDRPARSRRQGVVSPLGLAWLLALGATLFLWIAHNTDVGQALFDKEDFAWAFKYPSAWRWPLKDWISDAMDWLVNTADLGLFTFTELTRAIAWVLELPLTLATSIFSSGFLRGQGSDAVQITPPLSWLAMIVIVAAMGRYARDWKLALLVGGCFAYLAVFGQWASAMVTLSSIMIAVPIGAGCGLLIGIAGYRWHWVERVITPMLDLMQTVPIFAYLVPILFLFGFGPVAAMIATIVYAMPPMVRVTMLALRTLPGEIVDLGNMVGCSQRQLTWKVLVPAASPSLMVGVNQVIMLSLNMVIIASMIGAGGLGFDVLAALRRLDIGAGIESGVAIVVLAIALDRLSQAFAAKPPAEHREKAGAHVLRRYPYTSFSLAMALGLTLLGLAIGAFETYPKAWTLTTGDFWSRIVEYINVNFFDELETVKTFLLLGVLVPAKRFLLSLPWPGVVILVALGGYSLGGLRLAALCAALSLFIAVVGLWAKA